MYKKGLIFSFSLIATLAIMNSCEKDNLKNQNGEIAEQENPVEKTVYVKSGVLCFSDREAIETTLCEINGMNDEELATWESEIGFQSLRGLRYEAESAIENHLMSYINSGISEVELETMIKNGEIQEIPQNAKRIIDKIKMQSVTDSEGMKTFEYSFDIPFNTRLLNSNYSVIIDDTLYQYDKDKYYMYPNPKDINSLSKSNAIVATLISTTDDNLKSTTALPHEYKTCLLSGENNNGSKKLKVYFDVRRYMYQNSDCSDGDCVWSETSFTLNYRTYKKVVRWWKQKTYQIDITAGSYAYRFNFKGWAPPAKTYYVKGTSIGDCPYYIKHSWDRNSNFPYIEFGEIDNFSINLTETEDVKVGFLLANANDKSPNYHGYSGMYRLPNQY